VGSARGWSPFLSVVGGFEFSGRDVAAVLVGAVIVPVDPFGGGQLHFVNRAPRFAWFDQFGLVETVDRLSEGVIVGAADRPDRGLDAGFSEPFGEPDRRILAEILYLYGAQRLSDH
jgi:hypothetical protein